MFPFKLDKAIQAAGHLLRRETTRQMNYMRLLMVLYAADRESVRQTGRPITGDAAVATQRGLVLAEVFSLIEGAHPQSPEWRRYFQKHECDVRLAEEPGVANLSRFEIELLEAVAEEHRARDEWAMVDFTHGFPEWIKNDPGDSSKRIPFHDILEAVGRSADKADIEDDARAECAFAHLFGA